MNRDERLAALLDLVAENGTITVAQITKQLGASPATVRRDLDVLAEQQLLKRTRGGASAHSVAYDLPLRYKNVRNPDAKASIARAASALVTPGATIGLCGGTTSTAIAEALLARADLAESGDTPTLTVVTNAVNIALLLAVRQQIKTVVTGGVVQPRSYELVGPLAEQTLRSVSLDTAFIAANAFDVAVGPSVHDEREAAVNTLLADRAERAIVVVDSSKIGTRAFATVGEPTLFRTVITDAGATREQLSALRTAGFEVIVASV